MSVYFVSDPSPFESAFVGESDLVEWLIAKGVDAGVKDGQGQTAKQIVHLHLGRVRKNAKCKTAFGSVSFEKY